MQRTIGRVTIIVVDDMYILCFEYTMCILSYALSTTIIETYLIVHGIFGVRKSEYYNYATHYS